MKKGSLATVFLVVLVDLMGFGIILPLLPFYASEFNATPVDIGLLYSVFSLGQLIFSPIWGSWSDRIGRRPIMLISTLGAVGAYILFGLAESLTVLFLSRAFAGVMGGNISTALAYITDSTTPEKRASGMGLIGAAFGIGFVTGPILASGLIHPQFPVYLDGLGWSALANVVRTNTFAIPAYFAALLSFVSFLLVVFRLPETVDTSAVTLTSDKPTKRPGVFSREFWYLATSEGQSGVKYVFAGLLISMFLLSFGQASLYSAFPLYCERVLGMSAEQVGIQFAFLGLVAVIVQGGLIRALTKYIKEERLFLAGNILMTIGLLLLGFSGNVSMLSLFLIIMAIGNSLNTPTLQSLLSQEADPTRIGAIMGMAQSIGGLGRVVGPTWGGALFAANPHIPFAATAFFMLIAVVVGIRLWNFRDKTSA